MTEDDEPRYQELTPATVIQISHEVRQGEASPIDARRVLELFCSTSKPNASLLGHVQSSIRAFLDGERPTMEGAFGISRRRGNPGADEFRALELATELLTLRMGGMPHNAAVDFVAGKFHCGTTKVNGSWSAHKLEARALILIRRQLAGNGLSEKETEALSRIFPDIVTAA